MGGAYSKSNSVPEDNVASNQNSKNNKHSAVMSQSSPNANGKPKPINMLLLGGPNVGKSTIFRQMKLLYMGGFTQEQRKLAKLRIIDNVLDTIVKVIHLLFHEYPNATLQKENMEFVETLEGFYDTFASRDTTDAEYELPEAEFWKQVKNLLKDPEYEVAYKHAIDPNREDKPDSVENLKFVEHGPYFLSILDKVIDPNTLPTDNEILMLRRVTEGRDTIEFEVEVELATNKKRIFPLKITDVGGQAHEQEEWKRVAETEELDSVIYICALSEFDQTDNNNNNILKSQLSLLAKIVKSTLFEKADLVVLMNKTDLLAKKLEHKLISNYFKAFSKIENQPQLVIEHFRNELEELSRKVLEKRGVSEVGRLPMVIPTCALDTQMIETIVPRLCENALMKKMDESGLM